MEIVSRIVFVTQYFSRTLCCAKQELLRAKQNVGGFAGFLLKLSTFNLRASQNSSDCGCFNPNVKIIKNC